MSNIFSNLGTSILPPSLNFFNIGSKKEKYEPKPARISTDKISPSIDTSTEVQKPIVSITNQKNTSKIKPVVSEKKKVSSAVHKSITKLNTTTSTLKALRKKYQEQRLAKQRIKNKLKATMRTRSCTKRGMLKSGIQLAPRKFLPQIKTKRHGLRSNVPLNRTDKAFPKAKVVPPKPKKKVGLKAKSSDVSNIDVSSEENVKEDEEDEKEEELLSEKSTSQIKRNIQRSIRKKICTRSKSEMRRITRSYSGSISPKNLSRRPTRKTKEAAAVYMEILGRKLVSPDLENEDNVSVESFPELPNARRIAQTENEIKAKVKQTPVKIISKSKDCKVNVNMNGNNNKRLNKSKTNKLILKSKRLIKTQRYYEENSDEEESVSSIEANSTRPITRQSLGKLDKPISRSLRSSSKNMTEVQSNASNKSKSQVQNCVKSVREKLTMKRKRDQNVPKAASSDKTSASKQKNPKNNQNENAESEEETLGMLLNKIKKKKDDDEGEEQISESVNKSKIGEAIRGEAQGMKVDLSKVSDDEESFRGFTKKAISKVLNSCKTHTNSNLLADTKTNEKPNLLQTSSVPRIVSRGTNLPEKKEETAPVEADILVVKLLTDERDTSVQEQKLMLDSSSIKTQSLLSLTKEQTSKKCNHEIEVSSNLIDMPLSTLHTRKKRVNMSTEQIEKWLNESSLAKEESKLEMENVSTFKYDPSEKFKTDVSHLSISTKIQHLVRPVNVTLSKLADKTNVKDRVGMPNRNAISISSDTRDIVEAKSQITIGSRNNTDAKEIVKGKSDKVNKDTPSIEDNDIVSKSDQNSADGSTEKKLPTEKKIFQPRKPFLSKIKERKTVTPNVNAFSPENESSVYAFESDTEVPVSTPFRRRTVKSIAAAATSDTKIVAKADKSNLDEDNSVVSDGREKPLSETDVKIVERDVQGLTSTANVTLNMNKFELPKNFSSLANVQVLPLDKLTTSWSNVGYSASIAVQVNLDETTQQQQENEVNQQKSTEISTQTETTSNENDDDNDGQLFYIPLQAVTRSGPNLQGQQLIQGVAVKLGTEGPTGPNQRVLLRAKLVTKPPSSARCPPIGTVQPTTRAPPSSSAGTAIQEQVPSTSTALTLSTAITTVPSMETQSTSPVKSEASASTLNRPTVGTTTNSSEKLVRSPKSSRERKTSIDSTKSGKRYFKFNSCYIVDIYIVLYFVECVNFIFIITNFPERKQNANKKYLNRAFRAIIQHSRETRTTKFV